VSNELPLAKFGELADKGGRFTVSPLSKGLGVTIGNSLRRVLLSSLPGVAVAGVRISGAQHEFSTLPNVVEDVFDIVCNLKGVVFESEVLDEPTTLSLKFSGKGTIKAKDISLNGGLKIVNPNHHIATLDEKGKLEIELIVMSGVGYVPAEAQPLPEGLLNCMAIDASYSPIIRVNHNVENIRVGKELGYDQLVLDVWTNGAIDSKAAVQAAADVLIQKLSLFHLLDKKPEEEKAGDSDASTEDSANLALDLSVDDLELSARSSNCLKRAGIDTVRQLINKDVSDLIEIKNFGKKSADEINDKLSKYQLELKGTL